MSKSKTSAPRGRAPATDTARSRTMGVRLTVDEERAVRALAHAEGLEPSVWLRTLALKAIRKAVP